MSEYPWFSWICIAMLSIIAAATVTIATVVVLLYARLEGVNLMSISTELRHRRVAAKTPPKLPYGR